MGANKLSCQKAKRIALDIFMWRNNNCTLHRLAQAGAKAVIQPGGSMRDAEVIAAADEHELAMVFTGYRHFKH